MESFLYVYLSSLIPVLFVKLSYVLKSRRNESGVQLKSSVFTIPVFSRSCVAKDLYLESFNFQVLAPVSSSVKEVMVLYSLDSFGFLLFSSPCALLPTEVFVSLNFLCVTYFLLNCALLNASFLLLSLPFSAFPPLQSVACSLHQHSVVRMWAAS